MGHACKYQPSKKIFFLERKLHLRNMISYSTDWNAIQEIANVSSLLEQTKQPVLHQCRWFIINTFKPKSQENKDASQMHDGFNPRLGKKVSEQTHDQKCQSAIKKNNWIFILLLMKPHSKLSLVYLKNKFLKVINMAWFKKKKKLNIYDHCDQELLLHHKIYATMDY